MKLFDIISILKIFSLYFLFSFKMISTKVDLSTKKCVNVCEATPIEKPVTFGELNQLIKQEHQTLVDGEAQFQHQSAAIKSIDKTLIQNRNDLNMVDTLVRECNRKLDIIEVQLNQNNAELSVVDAKIKWLEHYMPLVNISKFIPKNRRRLNFLQKMLSTETLLMHLKNQDGEMSLLLDGSFLSPQDNPVVFYLIDSHCKVLENVLNMLLHLENKMKATQAIFQNISFKL